MTLEQQNSLYAESKAIQTWLNEIAMSGQLTGEGYQLLMEAIGYLHRHAERIRSLETKEVL